MNNHIKNLLSPFLRNTKQSWKIDLLKKWPTIMGSLSEHVSIEKIDTDTITLGVCDSSWLQELYMMGSTILATINQNLDEPRLKTIRFKQKGIEPTRKKIMSPEAQKITCIRFTKDEELALERITDSTLRNALRAFLIRCHQERDK